MRKLFTNDKFFLIIVIFTLFSGIMCSILYHIAYKLSWTYSFLVLVEMNYVLALYIANKKNNKRVMHGMMGALLFVAVYNCISNFSNYEKVITMSVFLVFTFAFVITHFLIDLNNHPNPIKIMLNQIFALILILTNTVWCLDAAFRIDTILANQITDIVDMFTYAGMMCVIICVEVRIDAYRMNIEKLNVNNK